nr:MAG TPA: hypothetical protein [Bacteriophage sp.]
MIRVFSISKFDRSILLLFYFSLTFLIFFKINQKSILLCFNTKHFVGICKPNF